MKRITYGKDKNIIYNQLISHRNQKELSQEQLAAKMQVLGINIDQQAISRIERNERSVTDYELFCFCIALGVQPEDMLPTLPKNSV